MHFYMHSYLHKIFILVKSGCYNKFPLYLQEATISLLNFLHRCLDGFEDGSLGYQQDPEDGC
jgi:hypothetical protein